MLEALPAVPTPPFFEDRLHLCQFLIGSHLGTFVGIEEQRLTFFLRDRQRSDFILEKAVSYGPYCPVVGCFGKTVLIFPAYLPFLAGEFIGHAHMEVIHDIPEAVVDHMILNLAGPHPQPPSGFFDVVGSHAHVLHAACNNNLGIAALDCLGRQHYCLERGSAYLVDGDGLHSLRKTGLNGSLFSGILAIAAGEDHAHDAFVHVRPLNSGPLYCFFNGMTAEIGGAYGAEASPVTSQGGPDCADNYCLSHSVPHCWYGRFPFTSLDTL